MAGSCLGFLWFNCHPARVFMGDTGSLSIGGMLGMIAICCKQELLLVIIGFVFVMEAMSVILQVASFKLTGKRIFKMSPIHHHFELLGWEESKVINRFWIISIIAAMIDADRAMMEEIFAAIPSDTPFPLLVDQLVTLTLESFIDDSQIALFNQINAEGTVNPKIAEALKIHYGVMTDRLELLIRRAQERKEIAPDVKPRDAAIFMMATFDGLCPRSAFDPSVNWRKMTRVFTGLMLKALGSVDLKASGGKR
jgi:hypothetical protein